MNQQTPPSYVVLFWVEKGQLNNQVTKEAEEASEGRVSDTDTRLCSQTL